MPKTTFSFRWKRAREVLLTLFNAYSERDFLYRIYHTQNGEAPQFKFIPEGMLRGSHEHLVYLFFVTLITVRSKSKYVFSRAVVLYKVHPELFTSEVLSLTPEKIAEKMRDVGGFAYPEQWSARWHKCATTLFLKYNGNPLLIFSEAPTVNIFLDLKRKSKNQWLCGYGPKLYSLYSLFCEELGAINHIIEAIPVDEHLQRICITTGIVQCFNVDDSGEKKVAEIVDAAPLAEFLREKLTRFCYKHGISVNELSHAMWFLGSEGCFMCPKQEVLHLVCPIKDLCTGGLDTKRYTNERLWDLSKRKQKGSNNPQGTFEQPLFMYVGARKKKRVGL